MATAIQTAPRGVRWRATTTGELLAEGLGTFILICFGDGVVAMAVAALNQSGRGAKRLPARGLRVRPDDPRHAPRARRAARARRRGARPHGRGRELTAGPRAHVRPSECRPRLPQAGDPRGSRRQEAISVDQTLPDQQTTCESVPDTGHAGRFSTGLEAMPPTPDTLHRGKYSEGLEQFPALPSNRHPGRFSDGVERLPETPAMVRRGSFADAGRREDG